MTVREFCEIVVGNMKITFDEDPSDCTIDVIVPMSVDPKTILGDGILDLDVNMVMAYDCDIIVSTNSRR